jgi:hypothetical protein
MCRRARHARVDDDEVGAVELLSCDRAEFMFALVIRFAPVSMLAGTSSPFTAAIAVTTP